MGNIFLPAAGFREVDGLLSVFYPQGTTGVFWSSMNVNSTSGECSAFTNASGRIACGGGKARAMSTRCVRKSN